MTDEGRSPSLGPAMVFFGMPAAALLPAWDSSPALVAVVLGAEHVLVYQNRASQTIFGVRRIGVPLREAFPELTEAGTAPLTQVLKTGVLVDVPRRQVGLPDLTGNDVVLRYV